MKSNAELKQLAKEVYDGIVFMAMDDTTLMTSFSIFMIFGGFPEDTVALYENISEAGPRSINGLPFFTSCKYLTKDEFVIFKEYLEQYKEIMKDWIVKDDINE